MWQALDTQMFPAALSQKCPKLPPDNLDLPRNDICQLGTDGFIFLCLVENFGYFKQNCSCRDFKKDVSHLGDVLCVDAVNGVAHVLLGGDNQAEGKHAGGGDAVVQPEDPAVDVAVGDVQEAPQLPEYLQHLGAKLSALDGLFTACLSRASRASGPYQLSSPITSPGPPEKRLNEVYSKLYSRILILELSRRGENA